MRLVEFKITRVRGGNDVREGSWGIVTYPPPPNLISLSNMELVNSPTGTALLVAGNGGPSVAGQAIACTNWRVCRLP